MYERSRGAITGVYKWRGEVIVNGTVSGWEFSWQTASGKDTHGLAVMGSVSMTQVCYYWSMCRVDARGRSKDDGLQLARYL